MNAHATFMYETLFSQAFGNCTHNKPQLWRQCRSARPGFTDGVLKREEEIPPSTGKLITIGLMKLNGPHSVSNL